MEEEEVFDPNKLRVIELNDADVNSSGRCVIYWMEHSQRGVENLALNLAIEKANELELPVVVFFGLSDKFPDANERWYYFMLEGLKEVAEELRRRRIKFVMRKVSPEQGILKLAGELKPALAVVDDNHTRTGRKWRWTAAEKLPVKLLLVDGDVIVPIRLVGREEYGAYTLRPKIEKKLKEFLVRIGDLSVRVPSDRMRVKGIGVERNDFISLFKGLNINRSVGVSSFFKGGASQAKERLKQFVREGLPKYEERKNNPALDATSHLSPYLAFGQISVHSIALAVAGANASGSSKSAYLETLIVRRELSENFTFYDENYDSIDCAPEWARTTLKKHSYDARGEVYSREQLEGALTQDELWNACMREMVVTGFMPNYLRMFWAKKILQWSETPKEAFDTALYLNNKYFIDGRCPNAYANIAWAITGKHDRPFPERPIFGKVRCMTTEATMKKFDYGRYISRVKGLNQEGSAAGSLGGKDEKKNSRRRFRRRRKKR